MRFALLAFAFAVSALAQTVASVSSAQPFELRGKTVPARGATSWTVRAGDELKTSAAPATLKFKDGTQLTLDPDSKIRVEQDGSRVVVRVLDGAVDYQLSAKTNLTLAANEKPGSAKPGNSGRLYAGDEDEDAHKNDQGKGHEKGRGKGHDKPPSISPWR
jgi:hypothetical protein